MPIYEYECDKCGHAFEREQRITEDPVKTCPECRSRKVKRLLSAPGFILKGGGWYADGYSDSKNGSSDSSSASGGNSDTKSETKSEPKSEPKSDGKKKSGKSSKKSAGKSKASKSAA